MSSQTTDAKETRVVIIGMSGGSVGKTLAISAALANANIPCTVMETHNGFSIDGTSMGKTIFADPLEFDEFEGTLVVPKNRENTGKHPQPFYRKGRW